MDGINTVAAALTAFGMVAGFIGSLAVLFYRANQNAENITKLRRCLFTDDGALVYCTVKCGEDIRVEAGKRITELETRLDRDEEFYMTTKEHMQLCENAALRTASMVKELINASEKRMLEQIKLNHDETLKILRSMAA